MEGCIFPHPKQESFTKTVFWCCFVAYVLVSFALRSLSTTVINSSSDSGESFMLFAVSSFITECAVNLF